MYLDVNRALTQITLICKQLGHSEDDIDLNIHSTFA